MKTQVIKNACSANYLNMMKQMAVAQENWSFLYPYNPTNPVPLEDKFPKLRIINNDIVQENSVLAGIALGLLIQIYDAGGKDYFLPECSACGISIKDKHRPDNFHTDHAEGSDRIKIIGTLNSDWQPSDGGGFVHGGVTYQLAPTDFLVFDSSIIHAAEDITSDKKRLAIDFTVKKK